MLTWREPLANFPTDGDPAVIPAWHFTPSPCICIWKPLGSIRRHGGLSEWKINGHKHSLWEKTSTKGAVLLPPRVRSMSCRVKRVHLWRVRVSYWSVTFIYCDEPFTGVSVLLKGSAKSKAVGDANTTYLFYSQVWNIKRSFNDSCVHLSGNLTALKIQGRGWNADKWRAGGI